MGVSLASGWRMTPVENALALAAKGFHVFPLIQGGKLPAMEDFPNKASRDEATIRQLWCAEPGTDPMWHHRFNVGIYTGRFGDPREDGSFDSLCVADIDNKNGKNGSASLKALREATPGLVPPTYVQSTPTGGYHYVYRTSEHVKNSVGKIGDGLDVRGVGGFIVGAGSVVEAGEYGVASPAAVAVASSALIELCGRHVPKEVRAVAPVNIDENAATARVREYLAAAAPAVEGRGGNAHSFAVAARCKDLGTDSDTTLALMIEDGGWNDRCTPPWEPCELERIVQNAFAYGRNAQGSAAPEAAFTPVAAAQPSEDGEFPKSDHPVNGLNNEHALVFIGGDHYVLWETKDAEGNFELRYLSEAAFHKLHTGKFLPIKKKGKGKGEDATVLVPVTKLWLEASPVQSDTQLWRRTYRGVWFVPEQQAPEGYYNVWRGFSVKPHPKDAPIPEDWQWALDSWIEHIHKNVCRGIESHAKWLIGWLAHMIQRPWEKPLTAVVAQGDKGSGKSSTFQRVADLLGPHGMSTAKRRLMTSQFNGHFERTLFMVFDEALWAGDLQGEGELKDLVTGAKHNIERKGKEIYTVRNLLRVCIIGNSEWLVPASWDERRYAVFKVGNGRQKDKAFFERQRVIMESGGSALLLRYLLDYDLTGIDVNEAPETTGLAQQKMLSMTPVSQWWYSSLQEGHLVGVSASFNGKEWPDPLVLKDEVRRAIKQYYQDRNIRERVPADTELLTEINKACGDAPWTVKRSSRDATGKQPWCYCVPPLAAAREAWDKRIGAKQNWE